MGVVVNKSFNRVRKDIARKAEKLTDFLREHNGTLYGEWTRRQNSMYEKLNTMCYSLSEELSNLEEIEVPEFERDKR